MHTEFTVEILGKVLKLRVGQYVTIGRITHCIDDVVPWDSTIDHYTVDRREEAPYRWEAPGEWEKVAEGTLATVVERFGELLREELLKQIKL